MAGEVPDNVRPYTSDLAVASVPAVGEAGLQPLGTALQVDIAERDLRRREAEVHSRMQRLDASGDAVGYTAALREAQAARAAAAGAAGARRLTVGAVS
ncbi:hypothetical protein GCM10025868_40920 [Angustibacter aerolatus]|uniref:Uncharacterized protein n=1 Tax=Angustibacter aerolatus TaxID=1162965 RepID=A0ABQ6JKQ6_9ACTN|nr:hypothetical protein GCM10025868_40920 [Angustibacter aerolatus]